MENIRRGLDKIQGKERVNALLYYHIEGEKLFIHLDEKDDISVHKKRSLYKEGLSTLADELENKQEFDGITFIIAGSWIVQSNPRLLERIGFKVFGNESDVVNIENMRKWGIKSMRHGISKKEEKLAAISREDYLKRPWQKK